MKNYTIFLIFLFSLVISLQSCYEDKGNYTYDWVEEVIITNLKDTVIGWGDTLSVKPSIKKTVFSQISDTTEINPEDYEYVWYTYDNNNNKKVTLSNKQYLNDTIYLPVRNTDYLVNYEVTEKATGVTWNGVFKLRVINLFQNGFLFLTEDEDKNVELEIYGKDAEGVEHLRKRILYTAGFPFRSGGANCVFYFSNIRNLSRIWIATGEGTGWLSGTDFT
ncbi:MAG: hypothetical protein LIO65_01600 [Odoribacter sp.]|nr:hypothetical protein [Odoribacter sp.]